VLNPSFENHSTCPTNYGQINYATGWNYITAAKSSEYFNACATGTKVSVPKNFFGSNYQTAKTGAAYAGVQTLTPNGNLRGNLCSQFITPLIANAYYYAKFYAVSVQGYQVCSNNLALSFSNTLSYTLAPNTTLNLPMHIYKFGNPVITDTLNWIEISGIYKANGTEQYLIIGNFKDSLNTKVDTIDASAFSWASYYLIDDVSIEPICTPFWSYRDTAVAIGDSVLIGPAITGLNINWYDASGTFISNAPGIYVKPNSPTFYTATEDFCGSTVSHTIHVTVSPLGLVSSSEVENSLKISPNPTDGILRISTSLDVTDKIEIKLTDVLGNELLKCPPLESLSSYSGRAGGGVFNSTIDITSLANGIYFIKLQQAGKTLGVKKVVKQ
jgi:hypothetical protein